MIGKQIKGEIPAFTLINPDALVGIAFEWATLKKKKNFRIIIFETCDKQGRTCKGKLLACYLNDKIYKSFH